MKLSNLKISSHISNHNVMRAHYVAYVPANCGADVLFNFNRMLDEITVTTIT